MSKKNPLGFFFIGEDLGKAYAGIGDGESYSLIYADKPMEKDKWHHIVFVFDDKNFKMRLYLNGKLEKEVQAKNEIETSNANLVIGAGINGQSDFFQGVIDEVRIYRSILTDKEVEDLYSSLPFFAHIKKRSIFQTPEGTHVIGSYDFDNDTPYSIKDSSGCFQNGFLSKKNYANFSTGLEGSAFDGSRRRNSISIPHSAYQTDFSNLTLSLWLNPMSFSPKQKMIVKQSFDNQLEFYLIGVDDGYLYGGIGNGSDFQLLKDSVLLDKNTWQHAAITIDSVKKELILYSGGKEVAKEKMNRSFSFSSSNVSPLIIGASNTQREDFFLGKIDDVKLYSSPVSPSNIVLLSQRKPSEKVILSTQDTVLTQKKTKKTKKIKSSDIKPEKTKKSRKEIEYEKKLVLYKQKIEKLKESNQIEKEKQKAIEEENKKRMALLQKKLELKEDELSNKETSLKDLIEKEKKRLEDERQKRLSEEKRRKELEDELASRNLELEEKVTNISSFKEEISKLQEEDNIRRKSSEKEKDLVQSKILEIKNKIEMQKEEEIKKKLEKELAQHNKSLQELQKAEETKRKEIQDKFALSMKDLSKKQNEIEDKEKQITQLREDIKEKNKILQKNLQSEKEKTDKLNLLITENEKVLSVKEHEINSLMESINSMKKQDSEQSLLYDQKQKQLQAELDAKTTQMDAIIDKNEEKYQALLAREASLKEDFKTQQEELQKKLDQLTKEHEEKVRSEKEAKKREKDDWINKVEALKKERETLVAEIGEKEKERRMKLQVELDKEKSEKEKMAQLLEKLQMEKIEMQASLEANTKKIESEKEREYQKKLIEYQNKIEHLKKFNEKKSEEKKEMDEEFQAQISNWQNKLSEKENELTQKETDLKKLIETEKVRLEKEKEKRLEEEKKRKELEKLLEERNNELKLKIGEIESMQLDVDRIRQEEEERVQKIREQELEVQEKISKVSEQLKEKQEEDFKKKLEEELKAYQNKMDKLALEEEENKKTIEEKLSNALTDLNKKQNELDSKESQITNIQEEITLKKKKRDESLVHEKKKMQELNDLINEKEQTLVNREQEINTLMSNITNLEKQDEERKLMFDQEKKRMEMEINSKQQQMEAVVEKNEAKLQEYLDRERTLKEEMAKQQEGLTKKLEDLKKNYEEKLIGEKEQRKKEKEKWQEEFLSLKKEREDLSNDLLKKEREKTQKLEAELSKEKVEKEKLLVKLKELEMEMKKRAKEKQEVALKKEAVLKKTSDDSRKEYEKAIQEKRQTSLVSDQAQLIKYSDEPQRHVPSSKFSFPTTDIFLYWNFNQAEQRMLYDFFTRNHLVQFSDKNISREIGVSGLGISFSENSSLKAPNNNTDISLPFGVSFSFSIKVLKDISQLVQVYTKESNPFFEAYFKKDQLFLYTNDKEYNTGFTAVENAWHTLSIIYFPHRKELIVKRNDNVIIKIPCNMILKGTYFVHLGYKNNKRPGFHGVLDELKITHSKRWINKIHLLPPQRALAGLVGEITYKRNINLYLESDIAKEYMISEKKSFKGSEWQRLSGRVNYTLTSDEGKKTLFIKFRNELKMESEIYEKNLTFIKYHPMAEIDSPIDNSYIPILR